MKKLVLAAAAFLAMSTSASAFAAYPICSDSLPRGQVCQVSATSTQLKTSCGNGKFLDGNVRSTSILGDHCAKASQATKDLEADKPAPPKGDATKAKAPSPVKPKGGTEVRQPDPGSEGAETGDEGSSGSSGSSK